MGQSISSPEISFKANDSNDHQEVIIKRYQKMYSRNIIEWTKSFFGYTFAIIGVLTIIFFLITISYSIFYTKNHNILIADNKALHDELDCFRDIIKELYIWQRFVTNRCIDGDSLSDLCKISGS